MGSKSTFTEQRAPGPEERIPKRHSLVAPLVLITLGVIFLAGQYFPAWGIGKTWPVLLLVIGVTKLFEAIIPRRSGPCREAAKPSSGGEKTL